MITSYSCSDVAKLQNREKRGMTVIIRKDPQNGVTNPVCNPYRHLYRDADKSLARPERKQANVSVRMA